MAALAEAVVAALPLQAGQELQGCLESGWCGDASPWVGASQQEDPAAGACLQQQHSASGSGCGVWGLGHEGHAPPMNIAA